MATIVDWIRIRLQQFQSQRSSRRKLIFMVARSPVGTVLVSLQFMILLANLPLRCCPALG
jgi:hypothetical protein